MNIKTLSYLVSHVQQKCVQMASNPVSYLVKTVNVYLIQSKLKSEGIHSVAFDLHIWFQTCNSKNQIGLLT